MKKTKKILAKITILAMIALMISTMFASILGAKTQSNDRSVVYKTTEQIQKETQEATNE